MAVYVDNMHETPIGQFGRMKMSHLIADTRKELIEMIGKIKVNPKWIQSFGTPREHFDICLSKRQLAVKHGAIEITYRELAEKTRTRTYEGKTQIY
jgi:hypothetical protein